MDLEQQFHAAMLDIYRVARRDLSYRVTRFLQFVESRGGVEAARQLLKGSPSEGFAILWEKGRIDLSMEAHVLRTDFRSLFTDQELRVGEDRLRQFGHTSPGYGRCRAHGPTGCAAWRVTGLVSRDRIAGTLLGMAAGDALGAGYEFAGPPKGEVAMIGGGLGGFAPGEWTDDTSMAVCIAEVAATGAIDLEAIGERFLQWHRSGPKDIGISTAAVLGRAASGRELPSSARAYLYAHPKGAAGNGALMRTAPVALTHLGDDGSIATAARAVAELTHADPLAGDSCVLWCVAIDRAVREDRLDGVRDGLDLLPESRRDLWSDALARAEQSSPREFTPNGFTVTALQAAYSAVVHTPIPAGDPALHLRNALVEAVRIGDDTDTVAAIAGMVLGARWGASAVPAEWRDVLHGWPGLRAPDLERLAVLTAARGGATND